MEEPNRTANIVVGQVFQVVQFLCEAQIYEFRRDATNNVVRLDVESGQKAINSRLPAFPSNPVLFGIFVTGNGVKPLVAPFTVLQRKILVRILTDKQKSDPYPSSHSHVCFFCVDELIAITPRILEFFG